MQTKRTLPRAVLVIVALGGLIGLGALGHHAASAKKQTYDYYLPSTSQTVYRGVFARNVPPALTIPSGATVRIDTLTGSAVNADGGMPPNELLADGVDVFNNLTPDRRPANAGPHYLTGPIYVEGAEPGDTLECRIMAVEPRVPWGTNNQGTGGALPGYLTASSRKIIRITDKVALFAPNIEIPLKPFQGVMGVAPSDDFLSPIEASAAAGIANSRPPGPFGGNMDLNDLGEGTSLFLPVFQPGAQFFTGDPHEVQGNGEVSGTALEQSNTVTIQFIVHKGGGLTGPRAETPTHYILMGIDVDHDEAMRLALRDALDFLQAEKGFTPAEAMSFASLAVDMNIAESVDFTQLVMARIPKRFFKSDWGKGPVFWHKPLKTKSEGQRQGLDPVR